MDATLVTVITGVVIVMVQSLTTAGAIGAQIYREGRQHRWEGEARDRVAATLKHDAEMLSAKLGFEAAALAKKTAEDHVALAQAVLENTTLTRGAVDAAKEAYHEANSVNLKIEKLGLEHNRLASAAAALPQRRHDDPGGSAP